MRRLASDGPVTAHLIGRDRDRLTSRARGARAIGLCLEASSTSLTPDDVAGHERVVTRAFERTGGFETVVLAVGVLGGQDGLDADRDEAIEVMRTNFTGAGSLLLEALRRLRDQGSGTLVVLSSVAAERPGRATRSTAPPRRGWIRSPRDSPTPPPTPVSACWLSGRGS